MKIQDLLQNEISLGTGASVIKIVDSLIEHAYKAKASDIHINPQSRKVEVRIRVDGVLQEACSFPKEFHQPVISRIKIMAGLRTDEHQAAQDGRLRTNIGNGKEAIDIRISICPTYYGENAVLRLLSDNSEQFTLENLGFSKSNEEKIIRAVKKPHGMILSTGPTGSGKTTTLYTLIKILNTRSDSIVTIEDPIEYAVEGIEQIQVNPQTGLTFANGLRSILRQDPNIIMVGEIRDVETASIAVNTALTGHLLLSTLHTNDAATTLPRLLDMKIEPFLVASTVNIAIAQRLVRRICDNCKEKTTLSEAERSSLSANIPGHILETVEVIYKGNGCRECLNSGYRGRLVIAEVLLVDDEIREAMLRKATSNEIKNIAIKNGMTTIVKDGIEKVISGQTTFEEVLRVTHD
jgi:type IV pilus assembly protein PilB